MAKESTNGKIQFVFVNVEGDQSTLQEALKQVGNALNKGMSQQPKYMVQPAPPAKQLGMNGQSEQPVFEAMLVEDEAEEEQETTQSPKPKRIKKPPKAPPLLKEEDLAPAQISFPEFAATLDVSTQYNKYLAVAYWFDKYLDVKEIGISHIYTCYQLMKWTSPTNLLQAFQNGKRNYSYFDNGSKNSYWILTLPGKNEVDKLMKKSEE